MRVMTPDDGLQFLTPSFISLQFAFHTLIKRYSTRVFLHLVARLGVSFCYLLRIEFLNPLEHGNLACSIIGCGSDLCQHRSRRVKPYQIQQCGNIEPYSITP
jgi:hypothetical protein